MSNLDPTHTIPLLVAGALQSGLAFTFLPRAGGFALMLSEPDEPFTDEEIELHAQVSAIADVDMAALSTLELSYQLGIATKRLAGHLVDEQIAEYERFHVDGDLSDAEHDALNGHMEVLDSAAPITVRDGAFDYLVVTEPLDLTHVDITEETDANE